MITVPQLDPVSQIQATDVIMITHADGTTEKITGENFTKAMAVDVIAENNMNSVTSNAVAQKLRIHSIESAVSSDGKLAALWVRQGNIVNLRIDNTSSEGATAGTYTISGVPIPVLSTGAGGILLNWGQMMVGYALIDSPGVVSISLSINASAIHGYFSYICAN